MQALFSFSEPPGHAKLTIMYDNLRITNAEYLSVALITSSRDKTEKPKKVNGIKTRANKVSGKEKQDGWTSMVSPTLQVAIGKVAKGQDPYR